MGYILFIAYNVFEGVFETGNVATCLVFVGELPFIYKLNDNKECKMKLL